jgi:hypothetical protein
VCRAQEARTVTTYISRPAVLRLDPVIEIGCPFTSPLTIVSKNVIPPALVKECLAKFLDDVFINIPMRHLTYQIDDLHIPKAKK